MGRAQAIVIDPATGAFIGGSDARGEGAAVGGDANPGPVRRQLTRRSNVHLHI